MQASSKILNLERIPAKTKRVWPPLDEATVRLTFDSRTLGLTLRGGGGGGHTSIFVESLKCLENSSNSKMNYFEKFKCTAEDMKIAWEQ